MEEFRERDQTALERAVETNSVDAAKLLIQKGANIKKVDKKQRSLLMRSAEQGLCYMIKLLLKAGADANAYKHVCARSVGSSPCNQYEQENETRTSLAYALGSGFQDAALLLIPETDLSCPNVLNPVLKYAGVLGHRGVLNALLEKIGQIQNCDIIESVKTLLISTIKFAHTEAFLDILNKYKDSDGIKSFLDDDSVLVTAVENKKC